MSIFLSLILSVFLLTGCSGTKTRLDCVPECRAKGMEFAEVREVAGNVDYAGNVEMKDVCRCQ